MFCNKCGASNRDDANFCQKCGYQFTDEELTQIAASPKKETEPEKEEKQVFSIRPTLLFVKIGYGTAVVGAFLLVVILYYLDKWIFNNPTIPWWLSILAGLSLLLIPAFFHLKQKTVLYTLTDSKVEIDEGFIFQNSRNVPLRSIQDVSVASSIWQRLLGFGNIVIDNASEDGGKIVLKNVNTPKKYADMLLKEMRLLDK